jgi:hypothetical protein
MTLPLPLSDLALWFGAAFSLWLAFMAVLKRLGAPVPGLLGAVISWMVARALISGVPNAVRWAGDVLLMSR